MNSPTISAQDIREMFGGDSYSKGLAYHEAGSVATLQWTDGNLEARVDGRGDHPYLVNISFGSDQQEPNGLASSICAACSCPVHVGCKHIVAALLAYIESPGDVVTKPDLVALLAPFDRNQIETLLLDLISRSNSEVYDDALRLIYVARAKGESDEVLPLSVERFRNTTRAAFRDARKMLNEFYDEMPDDESARTLFFPLIEELEEMVKAGRADMAIPPLEAITVEFSKANWRDYDEDCASEEFWDDVRRSLSDLWLHVALEASLSRKDRLEWSGKLLRWSEQSGETDLFDTARKALEHGWDDPILVAMLRTGKSGPDSDAWEARAVYAKRIVVLQARGRIEEMLNLALATDNHLAAVLAYIQNGQAGQSASHAMAHISRERDILTVCQALQAAGELDEALRLGAYGITLPKDNYYFEFSQRLSVWTRDSAHGDGNTELELLAAVRAYDEVPSLAEYERIRMLSGDEWHDKKEALLRRLFDGNAPPDAGVDIFLQEGRWEDALNIAEAHPYGLTLDRAIRATLRHLPDRAITVAKRQAESIMNNAKSSHY